MCDLFDAVFADERAIRESGAADPAAILKARGSEANKSHVAELEAAIAEDLKSEPEKSPLWCAASYFSSMRGELLTFMSDGRASADNNAVLGRWNNYADMLAAPPRRIGLSRMNQSA